MNKSIEELFEKMKEDKTFAESILSQTEKEKVIELAKSEGIEMTLEDIDEANAIILKGIQTKQEGELSEEELENVAGGFLIEVGIGLLTSAAVAATISASAAASAAFSASVVTTAASATAASIMSIAVVQKETK